MAVDFAGDYDYYGIASIADISGAYGNSSGTWSSFFVISTGNVVAGGVHVIFSSSQTNTGIRFAKVYDDLKITKGGETEYTFSVNMPASSKMLFVATYDHTNGAYKLYYVLSDGTGYGLLTTTNTNAIKTGTGTAYIGRSTFAEYFEENLYELAVWKGVVLTANEAHQLIFSKIKRLPLQIQPANLIGYWGFDDQPIQTGINGLALKDLSFSGADGVGVDADGDSAIIPETILSYPQDICYVDAYSVVASGNIKKICGIPWANVKKVSGIAKANIKKIAGISAQ